MAAPAEPKTYTVHGTITLREPHKQWPGSWTYPTPPECAAGTFRIKARPLGDGRQCCPMCGLDMTA